MSIFPMSVATNFCDMPLPKYSDSKTVLIYRPHPVYPMDIFECWLDEAQLATLILSLKLNGSLDFFVEIAFHQLDRLWMPRSWDFVLLGSISDPDPGSGAFLTPGSVIWNRFFPDPGFQIPDSGSLISDPGSRIPDPKPIFLRAFWAKSSIILWKLDQIFFFSISKINNLQFCEIYRYKKGMTTNFFFTPLFCCCFWFRDLESVKIRIRDKHSGSATLILGNRTFLNCIWCELCKASDFCFACMAENNLIIPGQGAFRKWHPGSGREYC